MHRNTTINNISECIGHSKETVDIILAKKAFWHDDDGIIDAVANTTGDTITKSDISDVWKLFSKFDHYKTDERRIDEYKRAYAIDEGEDLTELEKRLLALQKKWIYIEVQENTKKRVKASLKPYAWWDVNNVLVIGDLHAPYVLKWYLEHCRQAQERFNCWTVIYIGDLIDFQSIHYHEKTPEELNPAGEIAQARLVLQDRYETFPDAIVTIGNHDMLPRRQARTAWLLKEYMKDPNTIFESPKWYRFMQEYIHNNVLYTHWAISDARKKCVIEWINMVSWHHHTKCGVVYHQNRFWKVRGMQTWVWIDYTARSFEYSKSNSSHPITACGVILDHWTLPITVPCQ